MDQLARLGVVFGQEGADPLIKNLEKVAATSKQAEAATEQFTDATKKAATASKSYSTGVDQMNAHVQAFLNNQRALKVANDNATKSSRALSAAGLNLSRQFSDVGVSLASGINPLMVLIQQGPQIADGFQVASAAGLSFKGVIAGLYAQLAPLIATLAPLALGVGAVAASVFTLVDAHNKQDKAIKDLNKDLIEQDKALRALSPWIFKTGENADLAADGQRNFDNWLRTSNVSIAEQNRLLKENTLRTIENARGKAADKLFAAQMKKAEVSQPGPRMMAGAPGSFSAMSAAPATDPTNNPFFKEAQKNERDARAQYEAINAYYEKALKAPDRAFGAKPAKTPKTPKDTLKEIAKAKAEADGRYNSANGQVIALSSIGTVGQENYTAGHLNKYNPGGDRTVGGDPMLTNAEDASRQLQKILDKRAKDRLDTEKAMWSGLTALSSSGNKKLAAIGKAAAIAEATIDGIKAVQKAYASLPFPFNLAAAATMAGLTAINVAKIAGVQGFAAGGYTGDSPIGQPAGIVHGQEFVMNAAATRQNRTTLEAMNAGRAIPKNPANSNSRSGTRVTVVKGDLFDAIIEENARRVAAPMADKAREDGAHQGAQTATDQYVRQNMKRLA